ncbi:MAG: alkylhydroperoxidase-related (seleno)protein [Alphaproteobacteria bacterium]|nr:alkylhydroperoxidase-related (seleno)protein [Alphaproteobacteria bacterium]
MMDAPVGDFAQTLRADLREAHISAWEWIARPGTWLTGEQCVAIAREVRNASGCDFCHRRLAALSPMTMAGQHDGLGELSDLQVDIVHRFVTDQARLTEKWLAGVVDQGIGEGEYVEIAVVVAMVMILDRFNWGIGVSSADLPAPQSGELTRYRPPGAKKNVAWVATLAPEDVVSEDGPLYPPRGAANIQRAFSLVPDAKRAYWDLANVHYVPTEEFMNLTTDIRAISRPQIELLASYVSELHNCFY